LTFEKEGETVVCSRRMIYFIKIFEVSNGKSIG
jgi:hypothetical protein